MGFQEKETVYRLEFEGDAFEGLVVKVTAPPLGVVLDIRGAMTQLAQDMIGKPEEDITTEDLAAATAAESGLLDAFTEHLVAWNVEDKAGAPIPADADGLRKVSSTLGSHIIRTWWEFVNGDVKGPLGDSSTSGEPSLVASLPMEPLSPSRAS